MSPKRHIETKVRYQWNPLGSPCWLWQGYKEKDGYGVLHLTQGKIRVHRLVYSIYRNFDLKDPRQINHHCDIPHCVNPDHLCIGTPADNARDRVTRNRQAKGDRNGARTHPEAIPRGRSHYIYKDEERKKRARQIRELYSTGEYSYRELGKLFNISQSTISSIINFQIWKFV